MKKFIFLFILSVFCVVIPATAQTYKALTAGICQLAPVQKYKDVSWRKITLNKMKAQTKKLSEDDKNVIKKYVYGAVRGEDTYLLINCYLRGNLGDYISKKDITTPLKCRLKYYADALEATIAKAKLPQNIILYRGIDEKGMKAIFGGVNKNINTIIYEPVTEENSKLLAEYLHNVKFLEKGFMSTSYDKDCIKKTKFRFEIRAPKNLQAVLIEDLGKPDEKEVIINCGYKWNIVSVSADYDKEIKQLYYKIVIRINF